MGIQTLYRIVDANSGDNIFLSYYPTNSGYMIAFQNTFTSEDQAIAELNNFIKECNDNADPVVYAHRGDSNKICVPDFTIKKFFRVV